MPARAGGAQGAAGEEFLNGTIRVDYNVSKRGRVRNLRTEASPPEFTEMQSMVHREIRNRIFRPKLVDGQPADSDGLVFEHNFLYRPSDLEELRRQQNVPRQAGNSSDT